MKSIFQSKFLLSSRFSQIHKLSSEKVYVYNLISSFNFSQSNLKISKKETNLFPKKFKFILKENQEKPEEMQNSKKEAQKNNGYSLHNIVNSEIGKHLTKLNLIENGKYNSLIKKLANQFNELESLQDIQSLKSTVTFKFIILTVQLTNPDFDVFKKFSDSFKDLKQVFGKQYKEIFKQKEIALIYNLFYFCFKNEGSFSEAIFELQKIFEEEKIENNLKLALNRKFHLKSEKNLPKEFDLHYEYLNEIDDYIRQPASELLQDVIYKYEGPVEKKKQAEQDIINKRLKKRAEHLLYFFDKIQHYDEKYFEKNSSLKESLKKISLYFLEDVKNILDKDALNLHNELKEIEESFQEYLKNFTFLKNPLKIKVDEIYNIYNPLFSGRFNLEEQYQIIINNGISEKLALNWLKTYIDSQFLNSTIHSFKDLLDIKLILNDKFSLDSFLKENCIITYDFSEINNVDLLKLRFNCLNPKFSNFEKSFFSDEKEIQIKKQAKQNNDSKKENNSPKLNNNENNLKRNFEETFQKEKQNLESESSKVNEKLKVTPDATKLESTIIDNTKETLQEYQKEKNHSEKSIDKSLESREKENSSNSENIGVESPQDNNIQNKNEKIDIDNTINKINISEEKSINNLEKGNEISIEEVQTTQKDEEIKNKTVQNETTTETITNIQNNIQKEMKESNFAEKKIDQDLNKCQKDTHAKETKEENQKILEMKNHDSKKHIQKQGTRLNFYKAPTKGFSQENKIAKDHPEVEEKATQSFAEYLEKMEKIDKNEYVKETPTEVKEEIVLQKIEEEEIKNQPKKIQKIEKKQKPQEKKNEENKVEEIKADEEIDFFQTIDFSQEVNLQEDKGSQEVTEKKVQVNDSNLTKINDKIYDLDLTKASIYDINWWNEKIIFKDSNLISNSIEQIIANNSNSDELIYIFYSYIENSFEINKSIPNPELFIYQLFLNTSKNTEKTLKYNQNFKASLGYYGYMSLVKSATITNNKQSLNIVVDHMIEYIFQPNKDIFNVILEFCIENKLSRTLYEIMNKFIRSGKINSDTFIKYSLYIDNFKNYNKEIKEISLNITKICKIPLDFSIIEGFIIKAITFQDKDSINSLVSNFKKNINSQNNLLENPLTDEQIEEKIFIMLSKTCLYMKLSANNREFNKESTQFFREVKLNKKFAKHTNFLILNIIMANENKNIKELKESFESLLKKETLILNNIEIDEILSLITRHLCATDTFTLTKFISLVENKNSFYEPKNFSRLIFLYNKIPNNIEEMKKFLLSFSKETYLELTKSQRIQIRNDVFDLLEDGPIKSEVIAHLNKLNYKSAYNQRIQPIPNQNQKNKYVKRNAKRVHNKL